MIDLSMKLENDHKVWNWLKSKENNLISAGHIGTHIDVYKKTKIPKKYMRTEGILIDCTKYDLDTEIDLEILKEIDIKKGDFVVFKTNIQKNNPYGSEIYINNHNQLSWKLIDFMISKEVSFVGIDCAGIRRGKEHFKADIKGEENKTFIIENLDLSSLAYKNGDRFNVLTVWIDNPLATGLSTRVLVDYK